MAGVVLLARQRGDDEARIGLALGPLGLGDDPAPAAPAVARRPGEVLEATGRLAGCLAQFGGLGKLGFDLADQPAVARQTEQEVDAVVLAPHHQIVSGKAGIVGLQPTGLTRGAQQDAHRRPTAADLANNPCRFRDTAGAAVDVGRAQLGGQQMPAAEHVKRQVAVIVVIAVKEAALPGLRRGRL